VAVLRSGLLTALLGAAPIASAAEHALLISIADYPPETGWSVAEVQDAAVVMAELLEARGWAPESIVTLSDAAATRSGLLRAIDEVLIDSVSPGDRALLYYTGHGARLPDRSGDEVDGEDEALVPWDARPGAADFGNLLDDDLEPMLDAVREVLGPEGELIVVFDTCHGGSAARGGGPLPPRRGPQPYPPPSQPSEDIEASGFFEGSGGTRGLDERAPLVVLSAARADQFSRTWTEPHTARRFGLFTAGLQHALRAHPGDLTYRELIDGVDDFVTAQLEVHGLDGAQQPQLQGDGDRGALSKHRWTAAPHLSLIGADETGVWVSGGLLYGLRTGAQLSVHPAGTRSPDQQAALWTGTVDVLEPLRAHLRADPSEPSLEPVSRTLGLPAFPSELRGIDEPVRIGVSGLPKSVDLPSLTEALSASPALVLDDGDPQLSLRRGRRGTVELLSPEPALPLVSGVPAGDPGAGEVLAAQATAWAGGAPIWTLSMPPTDASLVLTVRAVDHPPLEPGDPCRRDPTHLPDWERSQVSPDHVRLPVGQGFVLDVDNTGPEPLWLIALAVTHDGDVHRLFPTLGTTGDALLPGRTRTLNETCAEVSLPLAPVLIRVIGTTAPLDQLWLDRGLATLRSETLPAVYGSGPAPASRGQPTSIEGTTDAVTIEIVAP